MQGFNNITLIGNLTRDPELRRTAAGKAVANFSLAVNMSKDKVIFLDITVWEAQAENCEKYLQKGSSCLVSGYIDQEKWKAKDGTERSKIVVVARVVQFLSPKSNGGRQEQRDEVDQSPPVKAEDESQAGGGDENLPF